VIGWIDASSGASGDMLLGALVGAGVPVGVIAEAVDKVAPEHVALTPERVGRGGLAATRCHVEVADSTTHRTWSDVRRLLADAGLHEDVRARAYDTFARLAEAEAAVHGTDPDDVHFHEVGALDAIADVVGVCAGLAHLDLTELVVSAIAVGAGRVRAAHGSLPVPVPAVVELLRGVPSYAGPNGAPEMELCTPTGAALLATHATGFGPQPPMEVAQVGIGAGGRDPEGHANVLRLLVGAPVGREDRASAGSAGRSLDKALVLETNVDDLDPRLWPGVLAALLDAGASDAWLTPILMKKGRPAHTLHVLTAPDRFEAVRSVVFRHTTTIGMREHMVAKTALDREMRTVVVDGHPIAVKVALLDGETVNTQPEYDDVARVAAQTGRPARDVLNDAITAITTDLSVRHSARAHRNTDDSER
jgi:pyridinium-3,5-bisthiocarboxylic acid mononucleotide nickel chelatase